ncbi:hypothetical protein [Rugamonas sp.]|uniref:hypothetical protein n=1 Tax=Rugamonas sp. TaxID=1926287 RepID=UPI0026006174|nr:hypothetical protein [Rugamonas sp.]
MKKNTIKAALMSALLFPGLGHLALKRGRRGCVFLLPCALAVLYVLRHVLQLVTTLADEINAGTLQLDPQLISDRVDATVNALPGMNVALVVCVLCWAGSIADAFWLGRAAKADAGSDIGSDAAV